MFKVHIAAFVAALAMPVGAALITAAPAAAWGRTTCHTSVWPDPGAGNYSQTETKPTGTGDPCKDLNLQVTGAAYFQGYANGWYGEVYCTPGSPSGTTINPLTGLVYGGALLQVYDDSSHGEDTRLVF